MSGTVEAMSMVQALNTALHDELAADSRVLLMGEDIGRLGGVFRVTDGLQAQFGEQRVVDTPLAEAGIVGTAVGLAMRGYRPVVEIQFEGFVFPAFDQIVTQVAKHHYRSGGKTRLPMVIRMPYGGGIGAVEHHSESPEAYFVHTPGLRVLTPSDPAAAYRCLRAAIRCDDPVVFLEPKRRYWDRGPVDSGAGAGADPDPWHPREVRRGQHVTLVGYGPTVQTMVEAAAAASEDGVECTVIDLQSLSPLDLALVHDSVRATGRCVIVHEAPGMAGVGAEVAARVSQECFAALAAPVLRVTGYHLPYPPSRFEEHYLPGVDRILDAIEQVISA